MTPVNLRGELLSPEDLQKVLLPRWIDRATADRAFLRTADSVTGAEAIGRNGCGDYSGILIPNILPAEGRVRDWILRRHHPDVESGKPKGKYLCPPGRGNLAYFPPGVTNEMLADVTIPVWITEGPLKAVSLWRAACPDGSGRPCALPIGLSGVWNWRGTIGKVTDADGARVDEKGVIPDLSRITWSDRNAIIVFDADSATNSSVQAARRELTKLLVGWGATVAWFPWPENLPANVKGVDDFLVSVGKDEALKLLTAAPQWDWRSILLRGKPNKKGEAGLLANSGNVLIALTHAPEWLGVLHFDESALEITVKRNPPWEEKRIPPFTWEDRDYVLAASWLQHRGINAAPSTVREAVPAAAQEHSFHPVRDYLNSLKWDGTKRIDDWLTLYLGASNSDFIRAASAKFLIGSVARALRPGCKQDCVLVLEGRQGTWKSTALRTMFAPWFTDQFPDIHSKDAELQTRGVWCIEWAELDQIRGAEATRYKDFISRTNGRVRPPYGRTTIMVEWESVFTGTTNHSDYLKDETGGRRFWPIACGRIDIESLKRAKDQLWAEAVHRYRNGEHWWIEDDVVAAEATSEQDSRYEGDAWDEPIAAYLVGRETVSVAEILSDCLKMAKCDWSQADRNRIGRSLRHQGWERFQHRSGTERESRFKLVTRPERVTASDA